MTLRQLADKYAATHYAHIPAHARPAKKFSESSAAELTKSIVEYLKLEGHYARRLSSEGRFRPGEEYEDVLGHKKQHKGQWLPGMNVGMSDVVCVLRPSGRFLGIEVKYGKDRQSEDQKKFESEIKAVGGLYFIAKTWDGFLYEMKRIQL